LLNPPSRRRIEQAEMGRRMHALRSCPVQDFDARSCMGEIETMGPRIAYHRAGGTAARTSPWVRGHGPSTWRSQRALSDEFTVVAWDAFAVALDRPQVSGAQRHALTSPSTPQTGLRALCPLRGVRQDPHRHLYCKTSSGSRAR
jgi:hypothetical protein